MDERFATGWHGGWYADCRDGKRRAVCHERKLTGNVYADKSEVIPPGQEWHDFFDYIKKTGEVIFQITDRISGPGKDRRTGYHDGKVYVVDVNSIYYDERTMTYSFRIIDVYTI
jgi:hypothetical protein